MAHEYVQGNLGWLQKSSAEGARTITEPVGSDPSNPEGWRSITWRPVLPGRLMGESCEHTSLQKGTNIRIRDCKKQPTIVEHIIHFEKEQEIRAVCEDHLPEKFFQQSAY